jgi:hypothetical protein
VLPRLAAKRNRLRVRVLRTLGAAADVVVMQPLRLAAAEVHIQSIFCCIARAAFRWNADRQ